MFWHKGSKSEFLRSFEDGIAKVHTGLEDLKSIVKVKECKTGTRICYVEDEPFEQKIFRSILEPEGYTVVICDDPLQFKELLIKNDIGMVVTDLCMPQGGGMEVLEALSAYDVPCAVISGLGLRDERVTKVLKMGIPFLQKPVERKDLLQVVRERFGKPRFRNKEDYDKWMTKKLS